MQNEVPVCLNREDQLGDTGDNEGLENIREYREYEEDHNRRPDLLSDHGPDWFERHAPTASHVMRSGRLWGECSLYQRADCRNINLSWAWLPRHGLPALGIG